MKIRVLGNSIRLRLTQSEVKQFEVSQLIAETVDFPGGNRFQYQINQSEKRELEASFEGGIIQVDVPKPLASQWIKTDQVGIEKQLTLESGAHLSILIEKDFQCLNPRPGEDERDAFPNPEARRSS